jgi:autoinducer 2-degrading protein
MGAEQSALSGHKGPVCLVVAVEIKEDRLDEFLKVIEADAVGSRGEPGCLRFDVLRSLDSPTQFTFIEYYKDDDAVAFHKAQPHFALWTDFKSTGGVVSQTAVKSNGLFMS